MQLCGIFEIKRGKNQQTFSFSRTKSVNKTAIFVALHDLNHLSIAPACPKFFAMVMISVCRNMRVAPYKSLTEKCARKARAQETNNQRRAMPETFVPLQTMTP